MNKPYNGPSVIDDYQLALEDARRRIRDLEVVIDSLEYDQTHAYTHEDGSFADLNDLRRFYHEHKNSTPKDDGRFQAYTEGFWKGFDMGYEKAKKE